MPAPPQKGSPPDALEHSKGEDWAQVRGKGDAGHRSRIAEGSEQEDPFQAEYVTKASCRQGQAGAGGHEGDDYPLDGLYVGVEMAGDGGQRHVHRHVQRHQEHPQARARGYGPAVQLGGGRSRGVHGTRRPSLHGRTPRLSNAKHSIGWNDNPWKDTESRHGWNCGPGHQPSPATRVSRRPPGPDGVHRRLSSRTAWRSGWSLRSL